VVGGYLLGRVGVYRKIIKIHFFVYCGAISISVGCDLSIGWVMVGLPGGVAGVRGFLLAAMYPGVPGPQEGQPHFSLRLLDC